MRIQRGVECVLFGVLALGIAAARAEYYDQPRELDIMGAYTQAASGMAFPEMAAGFTRTGIVRYNSEGTDESAEYLLDAPGKEIGISVYIYPVPINLAGELAKVLPSDELTRTRSMLSEQLFADEEQSIIEVHSGANILNEGATSVEQGGVAYPGYIASFRYAEDFFGQVQPVRSQLYLFPMVGEKWMVKYRVTYPDSLNGAAEVGEFVRALPWTIRGLK